MWEAVLFVDRYSPAVLFTAVAFFYTWRILAARRQLGHSPVSFGARGTLAYRLSLTFRVFRVLIWFVSVARAIWPATDRALVMLTLLAHPLVMLVGNIVLWGSFLWIVRMNLQLRDAWRSGLTEDARATPLRTDGIHARCRHPMFAVIMLAQLGLFLAIPSLFTLICLAVGVLTLLRQAEVEEVDLARRYGAQWWAYAATTPKWPWSPWLRHRTR